MNGRYMGQIMAECDCKHSPFCEKRGYCMAERIGESDRAIANLQREYDKRGDRIEALVKENTALKEHVADMLAEQECGCGYDNPTDVCLGHLPLHRKTVARAEQLAATNEQLEAALHNCVGMLDQLVAESGRDIEWGAEDPFRMGEWFEPEDLAQIEQARAALKGDDHE